MSTLRRLSLLAMLLMMGIGAPSILTRNPSEPSRAALAPPQAAQQDWCCLAGLSCCIDPPRPPAR